LYPNERVVSTLGLLLPLKIKMPREKQFGFCAYIGLQSEITLFETEKQGEASTSIS
jgi:hypothetical protein